MENTLIKKEDVLDLINDLYYEIQDMRENGEGDLRSVLHRMDKLEREVKKL